MRFVLLALSVLLLAGCGTVDSVRERIAASNPPRTRVVPAEPRLAYTAARASLDQMGFTFTRGGPAEGELEALSQVGPGDTPGSSHQFSLKAQFHAVDGGTEVDVWMKEIVEDDTEKRPGLAITTPLRDTPLYEVFFRGILTSLGAPVKG